MLHKLLKIQYLVESDNHSTNYHAIDMCYFSGVRIICPFGSDIPISRTK